MVCSKRRCGSFDDRNNVKTSGNCSGCIHRRSHVSRVLTLFVISLFSLSEMRGVVASPPRNLRNNNHGNNFNNHHNNNNNKNNIGNNRNNVADSNSNESTLLTATIGYYPGYDGFIDPEFGGHVEVNFEGEEMQVLLNLTMEEEDCIECGIHIHTGMSCDDADSVGGHYWNSTAINYDPWTADNEAFYETNPMGLENAFFIINSGYDLQDNVGHAIVLHLEDNMRIGCGILSYSDSDSPNANDDTQGNGNDTTDTPTIDPTSSPTGTPDTNGSLDNNDGGFPNGNGDTDDNTDGDGIGNDNNTTPSPSVSPDNNEDYTSSPTITPTHESTSSPTNSPTNGNTTPSPSVSPVNNEDYTSSPTITPTHESTSSPTNSPTSMVDGTDDDLDFDDQNGPNDPNREDDIFYYLDDVNDPNDPDQDDADFSPTKSPIRDNDDYDGVDDPDQDDADFSPTKSPIRDNDDYDGVGGNDDYYDGDDNSMTPITSSPTKSPIKSSLTGDVNDFIDTEKNEIKSLASDRTADVLALLLGIFGLVGMIFTAWQIMENPDGLCTSCCRLVVKATGFLLKIVFLPCRLCCIRKGYTGPNPNSPTNSAMFVTSDQFSNGVELT